MMSGYQFIHIEAYSRVASKKNKRQSSKGMLKELMRSPDACPHVQKIKEPILVHGIDPWKVLELAENQAVIAKDNLNRKFRKDGLMLVAGVASYPARTDEISFNNKELQNWLKLTIEFLSERYGDQLKSVVVHSDEPFWHCHFILVPDLNHDKNLDIGRVHDGIAARNAVGHKSSAKIKLRAYSEAMRAFQDDYHETVGKACGLTRDGPKRRRITRKEWKIEQEASKRLASAEIENKRIESALLLVNNINKELNKRDAQLKKKEQAFVSLLKNFTSSFENLKEILIYLKKYKNNKIERVKSL